MIHKVPNPINNHVPSVGIPFLVVATHVGSGSLNPIPSTPNTGAIIIGIPINITVKKIK